MLLNTDPPGMSHPVATLVIVLTSSIRLSCLAAPPNAPWVEFVAGAEPSGCVAVYYSDRLSRLAVREVTRPADNKSDPNIETGTFGLFSTCERDMRAGVRKRGVTRLFFLSSHGGQSRALTGYYDLGWWAYGRLEGRSADVCLAARALRFIESPVPLTDLPPASRKALNSGFRTTKYVDEQVTAELVDVLESRPDATAAYIAEVDRLERFSLHYTGFRCWHRTEPFSWDAAGHLVSAEPPLKTTRTIGNSSPTGRWRCRDCTNELTNQSRLKECPHCHHVGTLEPAA